MPRIRPHQLATPLSPTLDWDVNIHNVTSNNIEASNYKAIHRNDNGQLLNISKKSYYPATNDKFLEIVHKIHEMTSFTICGYSEFGGGKKVLAYLKNQEPMKIGDFTTENYMIVGNSFDCSTGFFTGISNIVLRCTNQFSRINVKTNIRHNSKLMVNLDHLVKFYHDYTDQESELKKRFEVWNGISVSDELIDLFVDDVLEIEDKNKISTVKENQRDDLFQSINREMLEMGKNAYGLFNGLTHYTTHIKTSREKIFGGVFGVASTLNLRGYRSLTQHVAELI